MDNLSSWLASTYPHPLSRRFCISVRHYLDEALSRFTFLLPTSMPKRRPPLQRGYRGGSVQVPDEPCMTLRGAAIRYSYMEKHCPGRAISPLTKCVHLFLRTDFFCAQREPPLQQGYRGGSV